jgi:hypothetical protein
VKDGGREQGGVVVMQALWERQTTVLRDKNEV